MALQTQGLPYSINGDLVIGYTNGRKLKDMGWQDLSTCHHGIKRTQIKITWDLLPYMTKWDRDLYLCIRIFQKRKQF